jgi:hypothetical protein
LTPVFALDFLALIARMILAMNGVY